ncbi:MAG: ParB/RepB/Spo0J family partition protein [Vicinamibacterales bacterium]|nr:ParB/RepB/Spo0J family partition protein [Vicinamibacterales bacterium]
MADRKPALGKGLSALIPDAQPLATETGIRELDIDLLSPNNAQPRGQMDDARLEDLARSIRSNGIIQPIIVRKVGSAYRIIAGERRWRAAQRAGLLKVPVVVRELAQDAERENLQLALIENIQREELNCIDEAAAYRRLIDDFQLTQEQVAAAVGKDRSSVANHLRLLKLPEEVRAELAAGALSMGHAKALLALPTEQAQRQSAREIVSRALSVREAEMMVRREAKAAEPRAAELGNTAEPPPVDVHTRAAEERMRFVLGTKVRIVRKGTGGSIHVEFTDENELNRLYERITAS